jgi:hypothetical protein
LNGSQRIRIALAVPTRSLAEATAAIRLVMTLLQSVVRLELAFVAVPGQPEPSTSGGRTKYSLLIAAEVTLPDETPTARLDFERDLRSHIERRYARHGVPSVYYDLQVIDLEPMS